MVIQPEKIYFLPVTLYVTSGIVTANYTASVTLESSFTVRRRRKRDCENYTKNNFIKLNLNGGGK